MAKATTRKKTKTSGRSSGGGKRTGPAGKSASSHRKTKPARAGKAGVKPAAKTSRAKKAARKTTPRPAERKTTSKKIKPQTAAKRTSAKKTAAKKAAARQTVTRTASKKPAAKQVTPKKAPAAKKSAQTAPTGARKKAPSAPAPPAKAPSKRGSAKGHEAAAKPPEAPKAPLPTVEEAMAQLPYHEGQFVVHPKYGLGKVDRITERKLSTRTVPCLEISFSYQEMRLTIPVDQVERSGLRRPISRREIDEVFKALKGRATFDAKRRSAKRVVDYRKRLNLGDPISLAEAIRDLGRLSLKKSLSYEERKILSTALRILSREVALARGREPDDVREEIEKIVYR